MALKIHIRYALRYPAGDGCAIVSFTRSDGRQASVIFPRSLLANPTKLRDALLDKGCKIGPTSREDLQVLRDAIKCLATEEIQLTNHKGWIGATYVTSRRNHGSQPGVVHEDQVTKGRKEYERSSYRRLNALLLDLKDVDLAVFCASASLAGPVLDIVGASESPIFALAGETSTGKTTMLRLAAGMNAGEIVDWSSTPTGFEDLAYLHNHQTVSIDEFRGDEAEQTRLTRNASSGRGKRRSKAGFVQQALPDRSWLAVFLVSTEQDLDQSEKRRKFAGERVRLIQLPVPQKRAGGIFGPFGNRKTRKKMISRLVSAIGEHDGWAFQRFVKVLAGDREKAAQRARGFVRAFMAECSEQSDAAAHRIAEKFAIVAAAGEFGIEAGVLPFSPGTPISSAVALFRSSTMVAERSATDLLATTASGIIELINRTPSPFPLLSTIKTHSGPHLWGYIEEKRGESLVFVDAEHLVSALDDWELNIEGKAAIKLLKDGGILMPQTGRDTPYYLKRHKHYRAGNRLRFLRLSLTKLKAAAS